MIQKARCGMGKTVFEKITENPETMVEFIKTFTEEQVLYEIFCEKVCTRCEECAACGGCIIDDSDTGYMLSTILMTEYGTYMRGNKTKNSRGSILDAYIPEIKKTSEINMIFKEVEDQKRQRDEYRIRTGDILVSEVKKNWSKDAKKVFLNIFSVNGMYESRLSRGIKFEDETTKNIFLQSMAANSLRVTDFLDCFECNSVAETKLAGAKEEIMTALEPYYIIFKKFQFMYVNEDKKGEIKCNA